MIDLDRVVRAVTDVAITALTMPAAMDPIPVLTEEVRRHLSADTCLYQEHEKAGLSRIAYMTPNDAGMGGLRVQTAELVHAHPGCAHLVRVTNEVPFCLSDVVSERDWLSSPFAESLPTMLRRSAMLALPVAISAEHISAWVVTRAEGRFSADDRSIAVALGRVIDVVARNLTVVRRNPPGASTPLTQRETAIMALLADGLTSESIARRLGISPRTVHKHLEHVYRKLEVNDRLIAVRRAQTLGIVRTSTREATWDAAPSGSAVAG
jgi:DNA-binding CsgD family transcriptional regulator